MTERLVEAMNEGMVTKATNMVAVGGVTMPAWYSHLQAASSIAATLVPILSAVWLVVQIVRAMRTKREVAK